MTMPKGPYVEDGDRVLILETYPAYPDELKEALVGLVGVVTQENDDDGDIRVRPDHSIKGQPAEVSFYIRNWDWEEEEE